MKKLIYAIEDMQGWLNFPETQSKYCWSLRKGHHMCHLCYQHFGAELIAGSIECPQFNREKEELAELVKDFVDFVNSQSCWRKGTK